MQTEVINMPVPVKEAPLPIQASVSNVATPHELMAYQAYAKTAVDSQMYRNVGREAGVMMIILAAREYGIPPCQALNNGIRIIEGNVELSARIMSALIRRAKHKLKIKESSDTKCVIWGQRRDTMEEHTVEYTIEMAQKAGLIKEKGAWKKNPEDMLFARAISRLSRQLFSDVVGMGYIEGEISDSRPNGEVLEQVEKTPPSNMPIDLDTLRKEVLHLLEGEEPIVVWAYRDALQKHFKWSEEQALHGMMLDHDLKEKFKKWKERNA